MRIVAGNQRQKRIEDLGIDLPVRNLEVTPEIDPVHGAACDQEIIPEDDPLQGILDGRDDVIRISLRLVPMELDDPEVKSAAQGLSILEPRNGRLAQASPVNLLLSALDGEWVNRQGHREAPLEPRRGHASIPFERLLRIQLQIALKSAGMDLSPVDRVLDGAIRFVGV